MSDKIIMIDDPEAATEITVTGWKSRKGRFFGPGKDGENMARYDGCTHVRCSCGKPTEKHYLSCEACRNRKDVESYDVLPRKPWDGKAMLFSDFAGRFFSDEEEVLDYCDGNNLRLEDLRLVICQPVMPWMIDPTEIYQDAIPDECDIPDDVTDAFAFLNKAIEKCKNPLSWEPSKFAVEISKDVECQECKGSGAVPIHVCRGDRELCARRCPEPEPCQRCRATGKTSVIVQEGQA